MSRRKFMIPGAENFTAHLRSVIGESDKLNMTGPRINGDKSIKEWTIILNGQTLGHFRIFLGSNGEKGIKKIYDGRIPGYKNPGIVAGNLRRRPGNRMPVDRVLLVGFYGNAIKSSKIVERQDGHKEIPFP